MNDSTPILDTIHSPADLRTLSVEQLRALASEIRAELIDVVSGIGGHLGAGLGVVELTIALHHVFNTPHDRLIWDVGHQAYPHKMLTGRRARMRTLRQPEGLSGFCKREESEYDCFGAGHSSTSISAALGMAMASHLKGEKREVIAVIGDGAMSAGMAYEALNNAGALHKRLIVILNDNDMSIAPAVGGMSNYLSRLIASHPYRSFRDISKSLMTKLPGRVHRVAKRAESYARGMVAGGGTLFEELGMYYIGPVDGHNLDHLIAVLKSVHEEERDAPVLIHVVTHKGKGFLPAEENEEKYHGVSAFDPENGKQHKPALTAPSYTNVFAQGLIEEARHDPSIIAITAAMPSGTGVGSFAKEFPERAFDVGIAEQHAVTFAAGLACEGMKPFVAIYSTFLQRAFDQVAHDVSLQHLPVKFAIDRAGLVGADGPTHAGVFDVNFLSALPEMVVMAAGDEAELMHMIATAAAYNEAPIAFRYPRGEGLGVPLPTRGTVLELGKGRVLRQGTHAAILNFGGRLGACLTAAELLAAEGITLTVADARFAKPLDAGPIAQLLHHHPLVMTVEEGVIGGFGTHVLHHCAAQGLLGGRTQLQTLHLPDHYQEHGKPEAMYHDAGMSAEAIAARVRESLRIPSLEHMA